MAKIKIGNTREIELLDAIKNPSAINFKIGNKFAELTEDISKTNGSPLLKFSKGGNEYYIREKFTIPVDKTIFNQTYTVEENKQKNLSGSVTITKAFTGRITVSGSYNSNVNINLSFVVVSNVGRRDRIDKRGYSFYKDVVNFTGKLSISGIVYMSYNSNDMYFPASLSVKIQTKGIEEA